MKAHGFWLLVAAGACLVGGGGCYRRPDPAVQAATDLQRSIHQLAGEEQERIARLNSLSLGMTKEEVRRAVGPPSKRLSRLAGASEAREVWIYTGVVRRLATLTFVDDRLVEIRVE